MVTRSSGVCRDGFKSQFAQIAAKNGITEAEAAKVFAREAATRTAAGNYIQTPAGAWVKK